MLDVQSTPLQRDLDRFPFGSVFAQSRIPMALVDRHRRYVNVNDAVLEVFQYPRAEVLGSRAGRTGIDESAAADAQWEQLTRTNELYGERMIEHANGTRMRVSYAAHATTVDDRWLALFVTLSARFEPDGPELIGTAEIKSPCGAGSKLTKREREVVWLVALGYNTRRSLPTSASRRQPSAAT
jgi:PAS domain-containing protein